MDLILGKKPSKVLLSYYTLFFPVLALFLSFVLYSFDKGPPAPPWGGRFQSIDCHSVKFESLEDRGGTIDFFFTNGPSIEYPPEYLPNFLGVEIKTGAATLEYNGNLIRNVSTPKGRINFSISHTWSGMSTINVKCLGTTLAQLQVNIKPGDAIDANYSRSQAISDNITKFHNVCIEHGKFLYFSEVAGTRGPVHVNGGDFRFEILKWKQSPYMLHKNVNITKGVSFLVAPFQDTLWATVALTVIPLSVAVSNTQGDGERVAVMRGQVSASASDVMKYVGLQKAVWLDDIMCFDTLVVTEMYSTATADNIQHALATAELQQQGDTRVGRKIVIADNLWDHFHGKLANQMKRTTCVRLGSHQGFAEIHRDVSEARLLIGNHISSLIYMMFLHPGASVLDLTPKKYACNVWARTMAERLNLTYVSMYGNRMCECPNFSCYDMNGFSSDGENYNVIMEEAIRLAKG